MIASTTKPTADCVFIGEAWGKAETDYEIPFVGAAGQELARMLAQANFPIGAPDYRYCSPMTMITKWSTFPYPLLNVFNEKPSKDSNNAELFYARPRDNCEINQDYPARRIGNSTHYVLADKVHHIERLHKKLGEVKPNLIVAMGATACWALGLGTSIGKLRGFVHETKFGKVLPIYHPAAILRNWSLRAISILDLGKAQRELQFPGFRLLDREIWTEPTIDDLWTWWEKYGQQSSLLAIDIETLKQRQISEVGFASDSQHALHIPFCWEERDNGRKVYKQWWKTPEEELAAWNFVAHVCASRIPKVGQNFQYDAYWLAKEMGIPVRNWQHDTLVAAHTWQPELGKSLYDLGAIFLNERDWKQIRKESSKDKDND